MYTPYNDPIVERKHDAQKMILQKAGGEFRRYSKVVREEVESLRKRFPGKFQHAPSSTPAK